MTLSEELTWRGFTNQTTLKDRNQLDAEKFTVYFGVDPSSDSMTIGNLAGMMMVRHFQQYGCKVFLLVGGATGFIGDPDGKDTERNLQPLEVIDHNKKAIASQFSTLLGEGSFTLVDNYDWFKDINVLDFLRNTGKHYSVTQLLDRDFIASRIGEGGSGISYAEFSYSLLQGYDFLHLFREYGVNMQLCGADQWGNSISGVDLVRKVTGKEVHIWSAPLVMNKSTGKKFGKSEDGAVWLDAKKTSIYSFYQFWLNTDDAGVIDYLKIYTLLSQDEIEKLAQTTADEPEKRAAQKTLAYEVTKLVHGFDAADSVSRITQVLFGGSSYELLQPDDFVQLAEQLPLANVSLGDQLIESLVATNLASSNTEARRFLQAGAVSLNGQSVTLETTLEKEAFLHNHAILKRGKNATAILQLVP